jgi:hypothetical protein
MVNKNKVLTILGLSLFGIYLFLSRRYILTSITLSPDEIYSWNIAMSSWRELFSIISSTTLQFFYFILLKIWLFITPENNDFWIRVPALLFGVGGITSLLYYLERYSRLSAIALACYVLIDPIFMDMIVFNRSYSLMFFLCSLNLISLIEFLDRDRLKKTFLVSLILLLFTNNLAIFYLAAVFLIFVYRKVNIFKRFSKIECGVTFFFLALFISILGYQYTRSVVRINWIEGEKDIFTRGSYLFIFFTLVVLGLRKSLKDIRIQTPVLIFTLGSISIIAVNFLVTPLLVDRYFFILYPALYLSLGLAAKSVTDNKEHFVLLSLTLILSHFYKVEDRSIDDIYSYRSDIKKFAIDVKKKSVLNQRENILCLVKDSYKDILVPYFGMHFRDSICRMNKAFSENESYDYYETIIFFDDNKNPYDLNLPGYKNVYQFGNHFRVFYKNNK